jgi:hypothetical protein
MLLPLRRTDAATAAAVVEATGGGGDKDIESNLI